MVAPPASHLPARAEAGEVSEILETTSDTAQGEPEMLADLSLGEAVGEFAEELRAADGDAAVDAISVEHGEGLPHRRSRSASMWTEII